MMRTLSTRKRRGFALVLVMAQITLLTFFWSIANRQTGDLLKIAQSISRRIQRDQGSLTVLATAVQLLETGVPQSSPYVGSVISESRTYLVTYTDQTEGVWKIDVALAPLDDQTAPLPSSFALPE